MRSPSSARIAAALGYRGLEVAPFTLGDDPSAFTEAMPPRGAAQAADHGLAISSLHWLLVKPDGLSLVSDDAALRARTLSLLKRLIDLAAASGARVLVHGSPKQRNPLPGQSVDAACERLEAALSELAPIAESAGVIYCIEPLSPAETPVINTVAQAAALVDRIGSPALRTMLDMSAASQRKTEPPPRCLRRFLPAATSRTCSSTTATGAGRARATRDTSTAGARAARLRRTTAGSRSSRSTIGRIGRPARRSARATCAACWRRDRRG